MKISHIFIKIIYSYIILFNLLSFSLACDTILNVSPKEASVGKTTTFNLEITPAIDSTYGLITIYVDADKKGIIYLQNLKKGLKNQTKWDYYFNSDSYIGEHYLQIYIELESGEKELISTRFFQTIILKDKKSEYMWIFPSIFITFLILIKKMNKKNLIQFSDEERREIFKLMITILPIAISLTILNTDKVWLKIGISFIVMCLITSFLIAIYVYIVLEKKSKIRASNYTLYSLLFLLLSFIFCLLNIIFLIFF